MATRFSAPTHVSSFRKMAAAMWGKPNNPTIYGSMDVDITSTLQFMEDFRRQTGVRLTLTHVVTRAVAQAFAQHRDLNAKVRFWGQVLHRQSVDLFVSVSTDGGKDLSGARVENADALSLAEIAQAISDASTHVRNGKDKAYAKSRSLFSRIPWWMARPLMSVVDLLSNEFHVHLPSQGMPADPFGTAVITNVGTFGIDTAFAPFIPAARCPMLLLITEARPRPWVVDGELQVRPVLRLCATFDHRIIDGFHAGLLARDIRSLVEHPAGLATLRPNTVHATDLAA